MSPFSSSVLSVTMPARVIPSAKILERAFGAMKAGDFDVAQGHLDTLGTGTAIERVSPPSPLSLPEIGLHFTRAELGNAVLMGKRIIAEHGLTPESPPVFIVMPFDGGRLAAEGIRLALHKAHVQSTIYPTTSTDSRQERHRLSTACWIDMAEAAHSGPAPLVIVAAGAVKTGATLEMIAGSMPLKYSGKVVFAANTIYESALRPSRDNPLQNAQTILHSREIDLATGVAAYIEPDAATKPAEIAEMILAGAETGNTTLRKLAAQMLKNSRQSAAEAFR